MNDYRNYSKVCFFASRIFLIAEFYIKLKPGSSLVTTQPNRFIYNIIPLGKIGMSEFKSIDMPIY